MNKKYDYMEAMIEDVKAAMVEYDLDGLTTEEIEEKLNDELWIDDSVTGNGSGSYTFCRKTAKEYVKDNIDILCGAMEEFGCLQELGEKIHDEEWEYLDVTIRCYLLGQAICKVVEE